MMKARLIKAFPRILLSLFIIIAVQRFCHKRTDGFALCKIQSELSYNPRWDVSESPSDEEWKQLRSILQQPFHYLGKGAQCYVFASEDDRYVLKFFRLYHLRPPLWMTWFPFPFQLEQYRQKKFADKERELSKDFESYKIAFHDLKKETALLFLHLNKTDNLQTKIDLYDKIGVHHRIDLDQMEFVLQKKAQPFYPRLEQVIEGGDLSSAKNILHQLVSVLSMRAQKGIFDKDPDINTNFGLLEDHPIQIDIGRFRRDETRKSVSIYQQDIIRITDHLRQWLEAKDPSLSDYLTNEIQNLAEEDASL